MSSTIQKIDIIKYQNTVAHPMNNVGEVELLRVDSSLVDFFAPSYLHKIFIDFGFFKTDVLVRLYQKFTPADFRLIRTQRWRVNGDGTTAIALDVSDMVQHGYIVTLESGLEKAPVTVNYVFTLTAR